MSSDPINKAPANEREPVISIAEAAKQKLNDVDNNGENVKESVVAAKDYLAGASEAIIGREK